MKKRILAMLLTLCMVIGLLPTAALADGEPVVAKIGLTEYTSLEAAISAVTTVPGQTPTEIELTSDFNYDSFVGCYLDRLVTFKLTGPNDVIGKLSGSYKIYGSDYVTSLSDPTVVDVNTKSITYHTYLPVAQISGKVNCNAETLEQAIELAQNGDTITLKANITDVTEPISITNKTLTIDFDGHQISFTASTGKIWAIRNEEGNTLTLQNGTIVSTENGVRNGVGSTLTLTNMTVRTGTGDSATDGRTVQNQGTVTIESGAYSSKTESVLMNYSSATGSMDVKSGTFSTEAKKPTITDNGQSASVSVSGGTFSSDPSAYVSGKTVVYESDAYTVREAGVEITEANAVAKVGDTYYGTLTAAFAAEATTSGSTVTLLKDIAYPGNIDINGKKITLNMNSHTITTQSEFKLQNGGKLEVTGTGTIDGYWNIFHLIGQTADNDVKTTLNIGKDITINNPGGQNAIFIDKVNNTTTGGSYGVVVDVYGKITGSQPIYVQGNITGTTGNVPEINIHSTADIYITQWCLYFAGYAKTTIEDGAKIAASGQTTGTVGNAIQIAAGELTINGGTITGGTTEGYSAGESGSITAKTCVAVYVKQHSTHLKTEVTINGGTFTAAYALMEETNTGTPEPDKIHITINGGKFLSTLAGAAAVSAQSIYNSKSVLTVNGGYFSSDPSAYCGSGVTGLVTEDSTYRFRVGEQTNTEAAETATAAPAANNTVVKTEQNTEADVALAASAATAISGSSSASITGGALEYATEKLAQENTTKVTDKVGNTDKNAVETLQEVVAEDSKTGVTDSSVKIVVQQYMDVQVKDATASGTKSITLDITPKAQKIATTATGATPIVLYDGSNGGQSGVNAIVLEAAKPLEITGPVTVTVPLPAALGFASSNVIVKHTAENGNVYYYTGTVNASNVLTFNNPHGFSEFEVGADAEAASAVVASNGTVGYTSLQAAVNEVEDGETIVLKQDGSATVAKDISFYVDNTENKTANITASGNYRLSITSAGGNISKYTFTYVASASAAAYNVSVASSTGGKVTPSVTRAAKGTEVTLTVAADEGKTLDTLAVTDKNGTAVALTKNADGTYTFTMPASKVTVTATFKDGEKTEEPEQPTVSFTDVDKSKWYNAAIEYVVSKGIMEGYGNDKFGPNDHLTRAQLAQILYNAAGTPEVTSESPFTDVTAGKWYTKAITWAYENGVVEGYGNGKFGPNDEITREQLATMIWRYAGEVKATTDSLSSFSDSAKVSTYAQDALLWATEKLIVQGDKNVLDPKGNATRAQAATMIMRYLELG